MGALPALLRLSGSQVFTDLMGRRPLASNDWLMIYAQPALTGMHSALGFVIPKKSLKHAVQRNRVRRWARAFWQAHPLPEPHQLLVRCRGKPAWSCVAERRMRYQELLGLSEQAHTQLKQHRKASL